MIKEYLSEFPFLSSQDITDFVCLGIGKTLKKGDYYIKEGETAEELVFIESGILRSFYHDGEGNDITYCITFPNNFMTAYSSFITGDCTLENIQAITDIDMLVFRKADLEVLGQENTNWLLFSKVAAERQYIALENRVFQLQRYSATERYENLMRKHPEFVLNIPLQYLASYLGITQRHLSRIRRDFVL